MVITPKQTNERHAVKSFSRLTQTELAHLLRHLHERDFQRDDVIYQQGQPAVAVFFTLAGSAGLFKSDADLRLERLKVVHAGESFGAAGILANALHHETAMALESLQVLTLTQSEWLRLSQQQPQLSMQLLCGLYQELLAHWHTALAEYQSLTAHLTRANIVI